jgi:hypothetical protein
MKLIFTKSFAELAELLTSLGGKWDESQPRKKVLRHEGGVLNWFETTVTISFQGPEQTSKFLEAKVKHLLYPNEFPAPSSVNTKAEVPESAEEQAIENGKLAIREVSVWKV